MPNALHANGYGLPCGARSSHRVNRPHPACGIAYELLLGGHRADLVMLPNAWERTDAEIRVGASPYRITSAYFRAHQRDAPYQTSSTPAE